MTTLQRGDLAGVGEQPLGLRDPFHGDGAGVLVDEQDLVTVLQQLGRDRAAHRAGPGDGDSHQ
jgi:hypothetical protein